MAAMCDDLRDCFLSLLALLLLVMGPAILVYLLWLKMTA